LKKVFFLFKKLPAVFFDAQIFFLLTLKKNREKGSLHLKFYCFPRKQLKVIFELYRPLLFEHGTKIPPQTQVKKIKIQKPTPNISL